ncbi:pyrroline-5-carboxylate reductase [Exilibacterium tricleocarpae]|uniref:Pyrroline-5-carboxylate reductase n=1 Tax=Exilibacterium tricleocarpae TaxID=2591008 RepID=A0A545SXD8_9GAMM|nr:pyrroline-5-carboxylate reductase [Exilibacterium tricleocarpae]TQV69626.1 pyrroline-5-carboxylate reductase [Exilibacterium tricleocarpae]
MNKPILAFIGAGNMANSIIGGLVTKGYPTANIIACDPLAANLETLHANYGIETSADNAAAARADAVVLAVKPQVMKAVAEPLRTHLAKHPVIISIAAGIPMASLSRWLGEDQAIVRCMPNTPALVQAGASGLFANAATSAAQRAIAGEILGAVGLVTWLENEALLDAVIAVSGSGPAYFFLFMEAMIDAGVAQGLSPEAARQLTLQTALGAATLAHASDQSVAELRRRVTSPGGTTEQAVQSFENSDLRGIVAAAMQACADRAVAMAEEMGDE